MKALLLNGEKDNERSLKKFSDILENNLKTRNYQIDTIILHQKK